MAIAFATPVSAEITADNFTDDALFRQYIADGLQLYQANVSQLARTLTAGIPPEALSELPSLQPCLDGMRQGVVEDSVTAALQRLRTRSAVERGQLAAFVQLLHSDDGARIRTLFHEAMAPSDTPDPATGMPRAAKDREAKLAEIEHIVEKDLPRAPGQLPQMALIMMTTGGVMMENGRAIMEARSTSPACLGMQTELDAYQKAHPAAKP